MFEKLRAMLNRREVRIGWQKMTKTDKVNVNESERLASILGGAMAALLGLTRRSPAGAGFFFGGIYFLYRGLTGHCPVYEAIGFSTASRTERLQFKGKQRGKILLNDQVWRDETVETGDPVDETVLETFPASDSPAWTTSRTGRESS
jgi:hypothetical protein